MKKWNRILSAVTAFALGCGLLVSCAAYAEEDIYAEEEICGTGAIQMTAPQLEAFHRSIDEVADMRLNTLAVTRIAESQAENRSAAKLPEPVQMGTEAVMVRELALSPSIGALDAGSILPASVDNSENIAFPPIGNQKTSNSCNAWALGYYQATNNIALVRGGRTPNPVRPRGNIGSRPNLFII